MKPKLNPNKPKKSEEYVHDKTFPFFNVNFDKQLFYLLGIIIFFTFIIFINTFSNEFVFDDTFYVLQNEYIRSWNHLNDIFTNNFTQGANFNSGLYRPFTNFIYLILYSLFELNVWGYHLFNVLIHICVTILCFYLSMNIFNDKKIAFFASLIFGVSSIHTEAVNNIAVLSELLASFFALCTLVYYIKSRMEEKNNLKHSLLAGVFLLFGLLSKENAGTIIGVIIILEIIYPRITKSNQMIRFFGFIFFFIIIYMVLRYNALGSLLTGGEAQFVDNPLKGDGITISERLLTAINVFGRYIQLLIFPYVLSCDYSFSHIQINSTIFDIDVMIGLLFFMLLIGLLIFSIIKKNKWSFLILFFFVTFSIVSNVFYIIGSIMAERFLYLPSFSFYIGIVSILIILLRKVNLKIRNVEALSITILTIISIVFCLFTINRNSDWKNNINLFKVDSEKVSNSCKVWENLAIVHYNSGDYSNAIPLSQKALQIRADDSKGLLSLGGSLINIGLRENNYQKKSDGERYLLKLYETYPSFDDTLDMYIFLSQIEKERKNIDKAIFYLQQMDKYATMNNNARKRCSALTQGALYYLEEKKYDEALNLGLNAVKVYNQFGNTHFVLGNIYFAKNLFNEAIKEYLLSANLNYNVQDSLFNAAFVYYKQGNNIKSKELIQNVININPNHANALNLLKMLSPN